VVRCLPPPWESWRGTVAKKAVREAWTLLGCVLSFDACDLVWVDGCIRTIANVMK
jgi:hypothetical protein